MSDLIKSVTLENGKSYNFSHASALKQLDLMELVGGHITLRSAQSGIDEISIEMVKGVLITLGAADTLKVDAIVLHQCVESGSDKLTKIDDFQGQMNSYLELLAKGIKVNLQDFFTWLDFANKQEPTTEK